jgi:hypothetical protein
MDEVRTDAIRSLERSVGNHWREGAVIGGVIGAGLGLFAAGFAEGMDAGDDVATGSYIAAAVIGTGFFGAIGAMFTSSAQKWERVF